MSRQGVDWIVARAGQHVGGQDGSHVILTTDDAGHQRRTRRDKNVVQEARRLEAIRHGEVTGAKDRGFLSSAFVQGLIDLETKFGQCNQL